MAFSTIPGAGSTDAVTLAGTSGVDSAVVSAQANGLFVNAEAAGDALTFSEPGNGYTVFGGQGGDTISSASTISGSIINGNTDADTININSIATSFVYGGKQNDSLIFGSLESSELYGNLGADTITVTAGLTSSKVYGGKEVDTITIGGRLDASNINGDIGNDIINIVGASFQNGSFVQGGQNEDTITLTGVSAFATSSSVLGGQGNDTINAANSIGNIIVYGNNDNDTVTTGAGADFLYGDDGNDQLVGGANGDSLTGGAGADDLTGGTGNDTFFGGTEVDTFRVDAGTDAINDVGQGGADNIVITAGATLNNGAVVADWTATAGTTNAGAATLVSFTQGVDIDVSAAGGANGFTINGNNTAGAGEILVGGARVDIFDGQAGNDTITGGGGADAITGGAGTDTFRYTTAATSVGAAGVNTDTLVGFTAADDSIGLQQGAAGALLAGVTIGGTSTAAAFAANVVDATAVANIGAVYTAIAANAQFNAVNFAASAAGAGANQLRARTISFANGVAGGTFLVVNDSTAGFQAGNDLVIGLGTGVVAATNADIVTFA